MSLTQHRLATDADARYRPFFSVALVSHVGKLVKELESDPQGNYSLILDVSRKLAERAKSLGVERPLGRKTAYLARIDEIEKKANETKNYALGARLLFRETMRLMCAVRGPDMLPQVRRITDPNQAADLLYQSFRAMISATTPEAKTLANLGIKISIGCGSWGEVFLEKHLGDNVETYLFAGIFSDLFCAFVNKYVVDKPDGDKEADLMLAALLEVTSIHPCAEQCSVFQAEVETDETESSNDDDQDAAAAAAADEGVDEEEE